MRGVRMMENAGAARLEWFLLLVKIQQGFCCFVCRLLFANNVESSNFKDRREMNTHL